MTYNDKTFGNFMLFYTTKTKEFYTARFSENVNIPYSEKNQFTGHNDSFSLWFANLLRILSYDKAKKQVGMKTENNKLKWFL